MIKSPGLAVGAAVNCPKCGAGFRVGQESAEAEAQRPRPKVQTRLVAKPVPEPPPPPVSEQQNPQAQVPNPKSEIRNPKPRPRDLLVDPNLLAPPPPRVKPKPQEVAVVCQVCGTRTYAPLAKIGQTIKCPDCHTQIEVPALKKEPVAKQAGPTLEGAENFEMSEVVERPKYRPLQAARGDYEVLSALDPAAIEQRFTVPGERPRGRKAGTGAGSGGPRTTGGAEGEISLAPVEERAEAARDPRTILPQPELEPENELYNGRYDDGVIGDMVDPRSPDAWKRAPFLYGIVELVARPSTLLRAVPLAMLLMMTAATGRYTAKHAFGLPRDAPQVYVLSSDGTEVARSGESNPAMAVVGLQFFVPLFALSLVQMAVMFFAVVKDTANSEDEVTSWLDWNVFAWFMPATYILLTAFISSLPGVAVAVATLAASWDDPLLAAFGIAAPIVLSWLVLFPIVIFSMLAEESVFAIVSPQTFQSLKAAGDAWVVFYAYSILIALLGTTAGAMLAAENFLVAAIGAAAMVAVLMVYARLVGRLMWVSGQREGKSNV